MFETSPILVTKVCVPSTRAPLIHRPRLTEMLNEALRQGQKLVLVSAPAGFGKTTLVVDWIRQAGIQTAWLSLGREDDNPAFFWRYCICAIQAVNANTGQRALAALEAVASPTLEPILATLINDLSQANQPRLLVLDDYHYIESSQVQNSLNYFIDHLPANLCMVITTRVTPPLNLSRWRSRGQLTEVKTSDLRFTLEETQAFLNILNRLGLSEEEIRSLDTRTEGWIVGLEMAVLSLRMQEDKNAFIHTFAGDDHYIVDYLLEEVLQHQDQDVQDFLVQTSILERLSATLCDAALGKNDSAAMLAFIERSNLFITNLDNTGKWYRYHHLFADLLRHKLYQRLDRVALARINRRACGWYEKEGLITEAINQALEMQDYSLSTDLMERHVLAVFYRSETVLVHHWLQSLPEATLKSRPLLCAVYANTVAHLNRYRAESLHEAETWLELAEKQLEIQMSTKKTYPSKKEPTSEMVHAFIALSKAYLSLWRKEPLEKEIALAKKALALLPPAETPGLDRNFLRFHSGLNCNLGIAYFEAGKLAESASACRRACQIALRCGDFLNASASVACEAAVLRIQGHLRTAISLAQETIKSISEAEGRPERNIPFIGIIYVELGIDYVELNELERAEPLLLNGLELAKLTSGIDIMLNGCIQMARLLRAKGRFEEALTYLDQQVPRQDYRDFLDCQRVPIWICQGNLKAVADWLSDKHLGEWIGPEVSNMVRALIALQRASILVPGFFLPEGETLVTFLEKRSKDLDGSGWVQFQVEWLMLLALAHQAVDDLPRALDVLERAVNQAETGGFIRLFVDEGRPMQLLLAKLKNKIGRPYAYLDRLLSAFGEVGLDRIDTGKVGLPEALSAREVEVLRLIAKGETNDGIATKLFISLNTAKKHITNIYGKLCVSNRAEAIERARELGLVI